MSHLDRRYGIPALLGVAMLILAAGSAAQQWRGTGRAGGVVRGPDGEAIAGATVILRWGEAPDEGPAAARTDDDGRWAILGLAPGRFRLTIRAEGYREAQGSIEVRLGPTPPVEVTLQSLEVVTPRFSERPGESVLGWIAAGNGLLADGEWAAARAEYEKALGQLEGASRAEVLRTIARTHYMEGDVESSIEALEESVILDPGEETGRTIYRTLMEEEDRSEEAERFLARVDAGEIRPTPPEAETARLRAEPKGPAPVAIETGRTGSFRTLFDERHPLSRVEVVGERFADSASADDAEPYDLADETFWVVAPDSYQSSDGGEPEWGLFVWISPTPSGSPPNDDTVAVLEESRLLWVGAADSGNQRTTWHRIALALDGAHNMRRYYEIDPERVYVGGYSGGGRTATALTLLFSDVFRGGLFFYGTEFYRPVPVPDRPGSSWRPWFPPPPEAELEALWRRARLVLLTGERDFNRLQTATYAERYEAEGFEHVTYIEVPGASHYDWPSRRWLRKAFEALDPPR